MKIMGLPPNAEAAFSLHGQYGTVSCLSRQSAGTYAARGEQSIKMIAY